MGFDAVDELVEALPVSSWDRLAGTLLAGQPRVRATCIDGLHQLLDLHGRCIVALGLDQLLDLCLCIVALGLGLGLDVQREFDIVHTSMPTAIWWVARLGLRLF